MNKYVTTVTRLLLLLVYCSNAKLVIGLKCKDLDTHTSMPHITVFSQTVKLVNLIPRVNMNTSFLIPHTHTQPFYDPFSGTTRVSQCQKRTSGLYDARKD